MKILSLFPLLFSLLFFTACEGPGLGGKVKKEYYTGGKVSSEFIMTDSTGQNGQLKKYGYEGHLTSVVNIQNGVKNGMEIWYDNKARIILKVPYVNGRKHGIQKALYPNGDIMIATPFQNGIKNGEAFAYNKDGSVHRKVIFQNGRIVN